jgi:hypothetical protein
MKFLKISTIGLIAVMIVSGCSKPKPGYLSNVLVYSPKTLVANKGRVTVSQALLVDGSTSPINVKLLRTRNYYTKQNADSILLKKYEIATYRAEVTQNDSTLQQIEAKTGKSMYGSFTVNPIGGRLELSPATNFIDTGTYEFDIMVTNSAGSREVNNAGIIRIVNPVSNIDITSQSVTTSPTTAETFTSQSQFTYSVVKTSSSENKIIIKFVDKVGKPFNPAQGDVYARADRPTFKTYDPFYTEEKTDTALVYKYPAGLPVFPIYPSVSVSGGNYSNVYYFRIAAAATVINLYVYPVLGFRLWPMVGQLSVSGTYLVTFKMNFVTKK